MPCQCFVCPVESKATFSANLQVYLCLSSTVNLLQLILGEQSILSGREKEEKEDFNGKIVGLCGETFTHSSSTISQNNIHRPANMVY